MILPILKSWASNLLSLIRCTMWTAATECYLRLSCSVKITVIWNFEKCELGNKQWKEWPHMCKKSEWIVEVKCHGLQDVFCSRLVKKIHGKCKFVESINFGWNLICNVSLCCSHGYFVKHCSNRMVQPVTSKFWTMVI